MLSNDALENWNRENFILSNMAHCAFARGDLLSTVMHGGNGVYVEGRDGNRKFDAFAGLYCVNVGYGRNKFAEANAVQARELACFHAYAGHGTEASITLTENVIEHGPDPMSKVYFGIVGSDANETNVKLAWYFNEVQGRSNKKKIISRWRAYHGSGLISGSLTGLSLFRKLFGRSHEQVKYTESPYPHGCPNPAMSDAG